MVIDQQADRTLLHSPYGMKTVLRVKSKMVLSVIRSTSR